MAQDYESDYRAIFLYTIPMVNLKNIISKIKNATGTLFILCGFPYSGKSYVSSQLQQQTDITVVAIDDIFKAKGFDWDTNVLPSVTEWGQIFNESYETVKENLLQGKNVLYDSTNQTVVSRNMLREVAESVGADACVLYIKTPVETVWQRWEENYNNPKRSVVSRELVQQTIDMFEEPTEFENVILINN
jgi:tRNA uridine 5-carbamoylmethylation protein Kti12